MKSTVSPARKVSLCFALFLFVFPAVQLPVSAGQAQEFIIRFDPAQTKIEFTLGSTLHTVEGAFTLKNGTIGFDAATGKINGAIVVDATSGQSGNDGRDRKMHRDILESGKYPEIIFTPNKAKGAFDPKGPSMLEVSGTFRLHGQDHDVTIPIEIKPDGRQLQLTAHITIPYIKWGLKSPSTFILRAGDKVEITLHAITEIAGSN